MLWQPCDVFFFQKLQLTTIYICVIRGLLLRTDEWFGFFVLSCAGRVGVYMHTHVGSYMCVYLLSMEKLQYAAVAAAYRTAVL
jgi:hypothetical protein